MRWWFAVVAMTACVSSDSVICADGRVCPEGTVCIELTAQTLEPKRCVEQAAIDACAGAVDYAPCATNTCYPTTTGHACLAGGCGNGILDPVEVCDDANAIAGDGCSGNCASNETCGNGALDPIALEVCDDGNQLGHD